MAAPSFAIVGTRLSDADQLTGWDAGNISSDDTPVQGSAAIGQKISATLAGFGYTHGTTFDLSGTNRRCIYLWMNCLSGIATEANGGLRIRVGNDASNYFLYHVAGSDNYTGGWRKFVVSPRVTPDATVGAPDLTNADYAAGFYNVTASIMGNFNNALVDALDLLEAVRATDGETADPVTFQKLQTWDTGTLANQFGVVRRPAVGVFFTQGRIYIGDGTTTTLFEDLSAPVVVFEDAPVDTDFYEMRLHANATLTLGELVAGAAVNGATILSAGPEWYLNLASGTSNLFGCTFGQCRLVDLGSGVTTQSCTFSRCGTVTPAGATITGGAVTNSTDVVAFKLDATTDADTLQDIAFLGNDRAIQINAAGTYSFDGLTFAGNTFDVQNNSGGAVTINVTGGGGTPSVENIGGSTTTVSNPKTHTVTGLDPGSRVVWIRKESATEELIPDSDVATSGWSVTGETLFNDAIDEGTATHDGSTTEVSTTSQTDTLEVGVSDPVGGTPSSSLTHQIRCVVKGDDDFGATTTLTVDLVEGTTVIASFTTSDVTSASYKLYTYDLTQTEVDNITDYTDLRLRFTVSFGGTVTTVYITAAELFIGELESALENKLESGGEASFQHDGTTIDIWVQILNDDKKNKLIPVTLGPSDETLPAAQEDDPFYSNPV